MKHSTKKEDIAVISSALVGTCVFFVLALVYEKAYWEFAAIASLLIPFLVYGIVQEKRVENRAKRIKKIQAQQNVKNKIGEQKHIQKETKELIILSLSALCIILSFLFCYFDSALGSFLSLGVLILTIFIYDYCHEKKTHQRLKRIKQLKRMLS